jgi:hypothetical protein
MVGKSVNACKKNPQYYVGEILQKLFDKLSA